MAKYISKQAFNYAIREAVRKYPNTFYNGLEVARQIAHDMDAADVVPVRHGRWERTSKNLMACTVCGNCVVDDRISGLFYCPNCGAKMDGEA